VSAAIDASALLAYLHQEPGWDLVQSALAGGCIGAVNWSEVALKANRKGLDVPRIRGLLQDMELSIVPFTPEQAETAAALWPATKAQGLSLADRACLALALDRKLPVLTADRVWSDLGLDIDIRLIR
jgi:PIN domain nuclease of toxin-antitoxin system